MYIVIFFPFNSVRYTINCGKNVNLQLYFNDFLEHSFPIFIRYYSLKDHRLEFTIYLFNFIFSLNDHEFAKSRKETIHFRYLLLLLLPESAQVSW